MKKGDKETLLALYKEKMSYLMAYDKIYSWMLGLLGMGLIAMIGFVLQHNVLQPNTGSSDFCDGEFTPPYSIKGLCDAIRKDSHKPIWTHQLTTPYPCTVICLNEQLKNTELCSDLYNKIPWPSSNLENLKTIIERDGSKPKSFSDLSAARQSLIKKLNRLLLEEQYPTKTPKHEAETETTSIITILIIFILFPLIINAWFSAYIFCYWYSYLLCQNIEYIEVLITNNMFFPLSGKFATWRNDFFSIFYGKTWIGKIRVYVLFFIIGSPLLALYVIICCEIANPHYFIESLSYTWKWIALGFYVLIPIAIFCIHMRCVSGENDKLKQIYIDVGIRYNG